MVDPFSLLLTEIIYRPIFNILFLMLQFFGGNLGRAVIGLTLIIRLILLKPTLASTGAQKQMSDLQPRMQELQTKYADDPKKLQEETMKLLKTQGMGPLKGCLTAFLQIPVFIGLLYVVNHIGNPTILLENMYSFIYPFGFQYTQVGAIDPLFFGMNLDQTGNIVLTVIGCVFFYLQMQLTMLGQPKATAGAAQQMDMGKMMKYMNIFMVVMIAGFINSQKASIGIYLTTTSIFSVLQLGRQYRAILQIKYTELKAKYL